MFGIEVTNWDHVNEAVIVLYFILGIANEQACCDINEYIL